MKNIILTLLIAGSVFADDSRARVILHAGLTRDEVAAAKPKYGLEVRIKGLSECDDCTDTIIKTFKEKKLARRAVVDQKKGSLFITLYMTPENIPTWPENEDIIKTIDTIAEKFIQPNRDKLKVTLIKIISSNRVLYKDK